MAVAIALGDRGRGRTTPNPNVGCVILSPAGRVVGRGWTQPGGRPHGEAMALAQAGSAAQGSALYVSLEPCFHASPRGPRCADLVAAAGIARVVAAMADPDPRTAGQSLAWLKGQGIDVAAGLMAEEARRSMAGFLTRQIHGRPQITLKLGLSLDGMIARADGASQWITGPEARAHAHLERARHDAILVGSGTLAADSPRLDVRLPGLEDRSPRRFVLGSAAAPSGWQALSSPSAVASLENVDHLMVEGGAGTASAFLAVDLVDRLLLYRAPILIGAGRPALGDIGLESLDRAHGRWRLIDARAFGPDRMELYARARTP